jgi:type IV pilus assembly protein PilA
MNIAHLYRKTQRGFTIVELLIVIVVIAILAVITVMSYQGISDRANTSSAKTTAMTVIRKIEVYSSETGGFPATSSLLTSAAASEKNYYVTGVVFNSILLNAKPASPNVVTFMKCGSVNTPVTGARVYYWDYANKLATTTPYTAGTVSGGSGNDAVTCSVGP